MTHHHGGCLCGHVRYSVTAAPSRVTICHCTFCQKITGSGYLVEPVFPIDAFTAEGLVSGYDHVSDVSGAVITVNYCPDCGTKLWMNLARFPDVIGVIGGTFDDPNWFARSGDGVRHVFARSAQAGTVLPADVDIYAAQAILNDGSLAVPFRLSRPMPIGPRGSLPDTMEGYLVG